MERVSRGELDSAPQALRVGGRLQAAPPGAGAVGEERPQGRLRPAASIRREGEAGNQSDEGCFRGEQGSAAGIGAIQI